VNSASVDHIAIAPSPMKVGRETETMPGT
jgi:hypothetical protein